ncbi:hypothetical protein [Sandaracinus amylolyticus]|uniref:Uncharacterized protein n=1 Tax=Sandaracinus amylolyticus TaxID=927083 RepID=A0A0F6W4X5_9BACT|nr:hypothetical protein [Sandaracinus amylolyticus]AKF07371.1 hypothetical protein DB32_004520 [Sandaracinus amylolyticus]
MSSPGERDDLTTLEGIRRTFARRFETSRLGYHALGEAVLQAYWANATERGRPASAMTFRNFLQGKTVLRDPTALELYFAELGATDDEMRTIRGTLQRELARRVAAPRQRAALSALGDRAIEAMPYSRAIAECEVVTQFEESIAAPVAFVTPTDYMLGAGAPSTPDPDPEKWGVVPYLRALLRYLDGMEREFVESLARIPKRDVAKRQLAVAADLREALSAYAGWLLHWPTYAELFFSRRRYVLHGSVPEEQRQLAIALAKRCSRFLHAPLSRFALEVILEGEDPERRLASSEAAIALEAIAQRAVAIPHAFYVTVVLGSSGTGAAFQAAYQLRREEAGNRVAGPRFWSESHDSIVDAYDETVHAANDAIERDPMITYGELKRLYDEQARAVRGAMHAVWEQDYASSIVREIGMLLIGALHERRVLSDREMLAATEALLVSRRGARILDATRDVSRFRSDEPPPIVHEAS